MRWDSGLRQEEVGPAGSALRVARASGVALQLARVPSRGGRGRPGMAVAPGGHPPVPRAPWRGPGSGCRIPSTRMSSHKPRRQWGWGLRGCEFPVGSSSRTLSRSPCHVLGRSFQRVLCVKTVLQSHLCSKPLVVDVALTMKCKRQGLAIRLLWSWRPPPHPPYTVSSEATGAGTGVRLVREAFARVQRLREPPKYSVIEITF